MADFLSFQVVAGLRFFLYKIVSYWHLLYFLFLIFQTRSSRAQAMT